jgi:sensor domain CHASE-containing protein
MKGVWCVCDEVGLMNFGVQQVGIVLMTISISFVTVGCSGGKLSQCANAIKVVNQTVTDTKMITAGGTKGDIPTIEQLVKTFDKAAKDMESVNVDDEKLKTYKSQFVTMYRGATEINQRLLIAIKEKKSTILYEELRKSRKIFAPERELTQSISAYCKNPDEKAK